MTRKHWSAVEISAYLDDALDHETRTSFEAALKHDKVLREKIEAVRETIHFVKSAPMRVPPRNYLLTPAMVKGSQRHPRQSQRASLRWIRLATSLTAVAFVITVGLNLLNVTPKIATTPTYDKAEPSLMAQESEFAWADEDIEAENHAIPAPQRESESQVPQVEENALVAPTPDTGGVGEGIGAVPAASIQDDTQETGQAADVEEDMAYAEKAAPPSDTTSVVTTAITPTQVPRIMMNGPSPTPEPVEPSDQTVFSAWWVAAFLGLLTIVLVLVTHRMSRHS